jgi:hypothetical protein
LEKRFDLLSQGKLSPLDFSDNAACLFMIDMRRFFIFAFLCRLVKNFFSVIGKLSFRRASGPLFSPPFLAPGDS